MLIAEPLEVGLLLLAPDRPNWKPDGCSWPVEPNAGLFWEAPKRPVPPDEEEPNIFFVFFLLLGVVWKLSN